MNKILAAIILIAFITALLRFLPFIIFHGKEKTPAFISYLGKVLPFSIMGMLVVFCLKSVDFKGNFHGAAELISILLIILIHWWKKNTILSILTGSVTYIIIVNFILK